MTLHRTALSAHQSTGTRIMPNILQLTHTYLNAACESRQPKVLLDTGVLGWKPFLLGSWDSLERCTLA